ncbi:SBBP repeat-containing protein, partial [bacterium]|nr:SBBP repeat-containing protein [bacterium]
MPRPPSPPQCPPSSVRVPARVWAPIAFALTACGAAASAPAHAAGGFVENRGQLDAEVLYYAAIVDGYVYLTPTGVVVDLREPRRPDRDGDDAAARCGTGFATAIRFDRAAPEPRVEARDRLPGVHHSYLGSDRSRWQSNLRSFRKVRYHDVWPDVDLVFRVEDGAVRFDVEVGRGGDAGRAVFRTEGARGAESIADRVEHLRTDFGSIRFERPSPAAPHGSIGRAGPPPAPGTDAETTACLRWSTFLGGSLVDAGLAVASSSDGAAIVIGTSLSPDFPTVIGRAAQRGGGTDTFVARISSDGGTIDWSTILGGSSHDNPDDVTVDGSDRVFVGGTTHAGDFPWTTGAYDSTFAGAAYDAFVVRLAANGVLERGTFLGGGSADQVHSITTDTLGRVVVAGRTFLFPADPFPTTGGVFGPTHSGSLDAFVAKLDADLGVLVWSTLLGGPGGDAGSAVRLDAADGVLLVGTTGGDFPATPGVFDTTYNDVGGTVDVFVARISADATSLEWAGYLGGLGSENPVGLEVAGNGDVFVSGTTAATDFPTTPSALQEGPGGGIDIFVTRVLADGSALAWSTYLGGSAHDRAYGLTLDENGDPLLCGETMSSDFPVAARLGCYDQYPCGGSDAVLLAANLRASGDVLEWAAFLSGCSPGLYASGRDLVGRSGTPSVIYLTGELNDPLFPTTPGVVGETFGGDVDAFVVSLDTSVLEAGSLWNAGMVVAEHRLVAGQSGVPADLYGTPDAFGSAIAAVDFDGDGIDELLIGEHDRGNKGAVHVLKMSPSGTVLSVATIQDTTGSYMDGRLLPIDSFGASIQNIGDLDGNSVPDLAVGANGDDDGGMPGGQAGAVWILFMDATGGVIGHAKISNSNGMGDALGDNDAFGTSVATMGNLPGMPGVVELGVGAYQPVTPGGTGGVWVVSLDGGGNVVATQKIDGASGMFGGTLEARDQFGVSLAAIPDIDGNGTVDLVVGAVRDSTAGPDTGAIWVLRMESDGTVLGETRITEGVGGFVGPLDG